METNMDLCNIANDINNEVKDILTKYLSPYLMQMNQDRSNMKCIENILRGMPEFQRLEKENIELRRQLGGKEPAFACVPDVPVLVSVVPVSVAPVPAIVAPVPESTIRCIKLDIIETTIIDDNIPNELELYKAVDLLHIVNNEENEKDVDDYETEEEASEAEEEASEAEEEEQASEAEEEAEEEQATEEEASEAEEEAEDDASEAEEEAREAEAEEAASEAEQEEAASEAEQEEAASEAEEEADEEQASEAEASEADEEQSSEAEEEAEEEQASEAEEEPEEEVSLIVINGLRYYTSNETNGDIYKVEGTDDVGDQVGKFVNKVATFF